MADPSGFLRFPRAEPARRPVAVRLRDWREIYEPPDADRSREQAARCMDCAVPFCHHACPLGNLIPDWNNLLADEQAEEALSRLHRTNNFPEFTGRLCPAPCESACVLGLADAPVTIERVEYALAEEGFARGWVHPRPATRRLPWRVAVVGSGPSGLAAAQQLARAGYGVEVLERADAVGGLLRYGIPEFKMQKAVLDRRLGQLTSEGVRFTTNVHVGEGGDVALNELRRIFDAVVVAVGAARPRPLAVEGAHLAGVTFAMEYLTAANRQRGSAPATLSAAGRRVAIIGGGDTGADCLGTAHRQGALAVTQLEILPRPPDHRPASQPWPTVPTLYKTTGAHEEGGDRVFATETVQLSGDASGGVAALRVVDHTAGGATAREIPATLVLLALGFLGPELDGLDERGALARTAGGLIDVDDQWRCSPPAGALAPVFACGDAVRGASLVVWAIAEGRSAAAAVDGYLRGRDAALRPSCPPGFAPWVSGGARGPR